MEAFLNLTLRNGKVFIRDKSNVFFSLLSIIIIIALYALFLQKLQVDALKQFIDVSPELSLMVNEWLVAGLLSIITVTTTLGALGVAIEDIDSKATADFLTAPISRTTIQMSYVANAMMIGTIFSIIALIGCELFIVATGGEWLSLSSFLKVIGIIILSVMLASLFNVFFVMMVNTQNAFATLSTIVGTLIGFLCGVYVPIGVLPAFAQKVIIFFPISHTTILLRNTFMENSIANVFAHAPKEATEQYLLNYGVFYQLNDQIMEQSTSYLIIVLAIVVLAVASSILYKRKYK